MHPVARADHVAHRDAFGDADDEVELRVDGLVDRRGGERRRHVDDGNRGAGCLLRFPHRRIDRNALEVLARLFRIHAGDERVATVRVVAAHPRVELTGLACDALRDDLGAAVDEDAHDGCPRAAATTFSAASAMLFALMIGKPDCASSALPSCSFVPFIRTKSGTFSETAFEASTMPCAITSQRM